LGPAAELYYGCSFTTPDHHLFIHLCEPSSLPGGGQTFFVAQQKAADPTGSYGALGYLSLIVSSQ
jgi:hypothetical protein